MDGRELIFICGTIKLKFIDRVATLTGSALRPEGVIYVPYIPTWLWSALPEHLVWLGEGNWEEESKKKKKKVINIKVSIKYKKAKDSLAAQGKRRYDRKKSGYVGESEPMFHKQNIL